MTEKIDKKEHLMDVAERLFADLGYDGASTRLIAKEAGVNMAMLNYYFGGKDKLLEAIVEKRAGEFHMQLQSLNDENLSSWEKLNLYIEKFIHKTGKNKCFQRIIHHELMLNQRDEMTKKVAQLLFKNVLFVKRILDEGIANGSFRPVDVEMTIATFFGTKAYVMNSSAIADMLLQFDTQDPVQLDNIIKTRLTNHLKELLRSYLAVNNNENK